MRNHGKLPLLIVSCHLGSSLQGSALLPVPFLWRRRRSGMLHYWMMLGIISVYYVQCDRVGGLTMPAAPYVLDVEDVCNGMRFLYPPEKGRYGFGMATGALPLFHLTQS